MLGEDFATTIGYLALDTNHTPTAAYGKQVRITAEALRWIDSGFKDLKRVGGVIHTLPATNEAR